MKIEFSENPNFSEFTLTPETPEETAQLLRMTQSSKAEKPEISFRFSNAPYAYITISKKNLDKQHNYLNNG